MAATGQAIAAAVRRRAPALYADSLAHALATHLVLPGRGTRPPGPSPGLGPGPLAQVTDYIRDNLDRDLVLGDLVTRHGGAWKDAYKQSPDILRTDVVNLLAALRLAEPTDGGLAVFPFGARYQPQVTTRPAAEQAAEQTEGNTE